MSEADEKDEYLVTHADKIGQILRGVRRDLGLTQEQVGLRAGLPQKEVSKMETSGERTNVERLFRFLSALELEIVIRPRGAKAHLRDEW